MKLKLPEQVRRHLQRHFENSHCGWLAAAGGGSWPLELPLGIPTEREALRQVDGVRAWVTAWQDWRGSGELSWRERRWSSLGVQRLPEKLVLSCPEDVARWIGEEGRWCKAVLRYRELAGLWNPLAHRLPRYFPVLADYTDDDYVRLRAMLAWISSHPHSNLYPRQLPVYGLDSKWLEGRKGLVGDLVSVILDGEDNRDFYQRCGLKAPPLLLRMKVLDQELRNRIGGLADITAPVQELAALNLPVSRVFIVENLQTGLAFSDIPGAVLFMRLGYHVDVLFRIPWISFARCIYWGDIDTHGFAILSRARSYLNNLESVLMDEDTLLRHEALWVTETDQHGTREPEFLTGAEQALYSGLKQQRWGQNVRLEQERIPWDLAWQKLETM